MPSRIIELSDFDGDLLNGTSYFLVHNEDAPVGQKHQRMPNSVLASISGRQDYSSNRIVIPQGSATYQLAVSSPSFLEFSITANQNVSLPLIPNEGAKEFHLWCQSTDFKISLYDVGGTNLIIEFAGDTKIPGVYAQYVFNQWVVVPVVGVWA